MRVLCATSANKTVLLELLVYVTPKTRTTVADVHRLHGNVFLYLDLCTSLLHGLQALDPSSCLHATI